MVFSVKEKLEKFKPAKNRGKALSAGPAGAVFRHARGNRYVLFIGDEGAILVYIRSGAVQSRQFVPDAGAASLAELEQALAKDIDAPVAVVIDSMDQSYQPQTLPPVSSLSVGKLVKRRLEREFGNTDIRGALMLGREKTGRKDWNFMLVAVEKSPQLMAWLNFVEELPNFFQGIYLVSVETENIVRYIDRAIGRSRADAKVQWKFFVSHNKVGGFRQVILRNGRIIFTRLAQPIGESSNEMVAGNIEQEMLSTIEYMKRLSFNVADGLDIYIIASAGTKAAIDKNKFASSRLHVFTPYEVAQMLKIEGATQPTDQFGDVVLAAAIGGSKRFILPLSTQKSKKLEQYHKLLIAQRGAAALAGVGALGYAGMLGVGMFAISQETSDMETTSASIRTKIANLREEISKSHLDIEKANDLLELYQQLQAESVSPLPFIETLLPIKSSPVWVKRIKWEVTGNSKDGLLLANKGKQTMSSSLMLEFLDVTADAKGFQLVSQKVLADMQSWFKGYEVKYSSLPASYMESDQLQIKFDEVQKEDNRLLVAAGAPEAELTLNGPLIEKPLTQPAETKGANLP